MTPLRLLTDTCAALKLAAFGKKIFAAGSLPCGDLILHPELFGETKKWEEFRKQKYRSELELLNLIGPGSNLQVDSKVYGRKKVLVQSTVDEAGLSVGRVDREHIITALAHKMGLVTNDDALATAATSLSIDTCSAERITLEALKAGILTRGEIRGVQKIWKANDEKKPSQEDFEALETELLSPKYN